MLRSSGILVACGAACSIAFAAASISAGAAGVEDFYKGKTVSMLIGYSVGGGYDLYGRLVARHMSKYIPGKPTIVPQNLTGAGSMRAAAFLYSAAPKDGSVRSARRPSSITSSIAWRRAWS